METKQTAVEYLEQKLLYFLLPNKLEPILRHIEQAKHMEKEQMIEFANKVLDNTVGDYDGDIELLTPLEDIYNETYNVKDN